MPTWDKDKPDTVTPDATQVGINDALNRTDHENLIKGIVDIRNKCKRQKKITNSINSKLEDFCNHIGFHFISNSNIGIKDICNDCPHLNEHDKKVIFGNICSFLEDFSKYFLVLKNVFQTLVRLGTTKLSIL